MRFAITDVEGAMTMVDAPDWMGALARSVGRSGDAIAAHRLVCRATSDGAVVVEERGGDRNWIVRPMDEDGVVAVPGVRSPAQRTFDEPSEDDIDPDASDEFIATSPPPVFVMPGSQFQSGGVDLDALAERLFELTEELASRTPLEAASTALSVLQQLIPCEAMSVLNARPEYRRLGFLAVQGPVANRLRGRSVPYGEGLVGLCHTLVRTILVEDVSNDWRHSKALDRETGFRTRRALCVPVDDGIGGAWGVIQLLNPQMGSFPPTAVDAVDSVARMLSGVVRGT